MFRPTLVLLTLVLTAVAARDAGACSCIARSACQLFDDAATVFVAEVTAKTVDRGRGVTIATMRVEQVYKGEVKAGEAARVNLGWGTSASCALEAAVGQRWLIYAASANGELSSGLCHGSHRLEANRRQPAEMPRTCAPLPAGGR